MKSTKGIRRALLLLAITAFALLPGSSQAAITIVQGTGNTHVAFEADGAPTIIAGTPESWVSTNEATANGGTALYADGTTATATSPHSFAQYSIKFATAGTYYLYYRWRADPVRTAGDAFTANSYQIANQFGAYSTPGDTAPFHVSASNGGSAPSDNVFDWTREADTAVYTVTPAEVSAGTPLVFTIGTREAGMTIDRFVFSTEAALTDAQLDALLNADTDTVIQKAGDTYASFEADGAKAKIIAGTPESWVSTNEATASGGTALYADGTTATATSPHSFAQYSIKFATAGTYYLYYRWRADPARTAGDAFTANSYQIANQFGAYSTPGDTAPFHVSASNGGSAPSDNVFDWTREADTAVYTVTPAEVSAGTPLVFTIGTREAGMTIDRFVFSTEAALTDAQLDALPNSGATAAATEIVKAVGSATLVDVAVSFTRALAAGSVNAGKFTISGLTVNNAVLDAGDARIVRLTTTPQTQGTVYTITVTNVTDTGGTPIGPNATVNFTAWKIVAGWALKEIYFGIAGGTVAELTADPKYPASPDRVEWVRGFQLNDDPLTDNYGARLTAFFTPQATGVHSFFINNDDEAELLLSSNESAANLVSLGLFPTGPRVFSDTATANSPASLSVGQRYLLNGLVKQQGGPVYLNVAAKLQSSPTPATNLTVLAGNQIATWVNPDIGKVTFTQSPSNVTAMVGSRATFKVKVTSAESPIYYQWRVNGADISGAVRATYTTPVLALADSGKVYSVVVSIAGNDTVSSNATLTVVAGTPPNVQPYIGVNFVGGGTFGGASVTGVDVAGVVQQGNWNNLEGFDFAQVPLMDAAGATTPVTLTATANEIWYTGTLAASSADGALLQGFINAISDTNPVPITLANVPAGNYHVLVYSTGFDFNANYFQAYALAGAGSYPTYHGKAERGLDYIANSAFRRMTNQTAGLTNNGNYVQFDNVSPAADGSLVISVAWEPIDPANPPSNGHSPAINAIQLARVLPVTPQPVLTIQRGATTVTISWTGGGRLQESTTLASGSWTDVPGNANPHTVTPGATGQKFYRIISP